METKGPHKPPQPGNQQVPAQGRERWGTSYACFIPLNPNVFNTVNVITLRNTKAFGGGLKHDGYYCQWGLSVWIRKAEEGIGTHKSLFVSKQESWQFLVLLIFWFQHFVHVGILSKPKILSWNHAEFWELKWTHLEGDSAEVEKHYSLHGERLQFVTIQICVLNYSSGKTDFPDGQTCFKSH